MLVDTQEMLNHISTSVQLFSKIQTANNMLSIEYILNIVKMWKSLM